MDRGIRRKRQGNPRGDASICSIITFFYTNVLLKKGYKKDLEDGDIYEVLPKFSSKKLGDKLEGDWSAGRSRRKTLLSVLLRCFGKWYLFWGIVQLCVRTSLIFILPTAKAKIVAYFEPEQTLITSDDLYHYTALVIVIIVINTVYNHNYQLIVAEVGLKVRTSLASLVYRRSLELTPESLSHVTAGKIVTLITRDVFAFEAALIFLNDMWIGLVQIAVTSYLIYSRIGWSVLSGVVFYLTVIPLQIYIGKKVGSRRIKSAHRTDQRLQLTTEALSSIKTIKMYSWEGYFERRLKELRKLELKKLAWVYYLKCVVIIIGGLATNISFFLLIMTYIWSGHYATAEIVYYIQSVFQNLKSYITASIPFGIAQCSEVYAALKRLEEFLGSTEEGSDPKTPKDTSETRGSESKTRGSKTNGVRSETPRGPPRVYLEHVAVDIGPKRVLHDVSLSAERGETILVVGNLGSGKSTLLKTILGDYGVREGSMEIAGTVSYASEEPWLFPSTIRQNIVFGGEFDEKRYERVLDVCALRHDLSRFDRGDLTICGDRGVNLSRGQQARINLARAIYAEADIYLLDDCLASLDAQVREHVFGACVVDHLRDKIVIIGTNDSIYARHVTGYVAMSDGGRTASLEQQRARLDKTITYYIDDDDDDAVSSAQTRTDGPTSAAQNEADLLVDSFGSAQHSSESAQNEVRSAQKEIPSAQPSEEDSKLLSEGEEVEYGDLYHEKKQSGKVKIGIYFKYYRFAGGLFVLLFVTSVFTIAQTVLSFSDKVVSRWINIEPNVTAFILRNETDTPEFDRILNQRNSTLNLYCLLIGIGSFLTLCRIYVNFFFSIRASRNLHDAMATSVLNSVMSFFDSHFVGNVINRFSKDLNVIDEALPIIIYEVFRQTYVFIGIMILIATVNVYLLIPGVFLVVKLYLLRRYYLPTGRNLKRLEGATRSPMIGYLNATLEGLSTIRASRSQRLLAAEFDRHQDLYTSTYHMGLCANRAFALWMDLISASFVASVILKFVMFDTDAKAGDVGLAITQATLLTGMLQYMVRQYSEIENAMTAVERVVEYTVCRTEDKLSGSTPADWPSAGRVVYSSVRLDYPTTGQRALRAVSFEIGPGERVGVVGRTGAGKSSIVSTLFRLYEFEGEVTIDGVDTGTVALGYLRSKVAIIPQDPVLFTGTLRSNIDPTAHHDDEQIWRAIDKVGLRGVVETLDRPVDGSELSSGERQLVCMSRALMGECKIIVLDEATASVDADVCAELQRTLAAQFEGRTVIVVAHRLATVLDCDRVMVVDGGTILEYDTPTKLLSDKDSVFYRMVKQSGLLER